MFQTALPLASAVSVPTERAAMSKSLIWVPAGIWSKVIAWVRSVRTGLGNTRTELRSRNRIGLRSADGIDPGALRLPCAPEEAYRKSTGPYPVLAVETPAK